MTKLSEMDRPRLERLAKKYKVAFTAKTSDKLLRSRIVKARKEAKAGSVQEGPWPKEWNPAMIDEYFKHVAKSARTGDDEKDYKRIMRIIDKRTNVEKPVIGADGNPDCMGLRFTPSIAVCTELCPHMPLCKTICEKRPDFADLLEEVDKAAKEVEGLSKGELAELAAAKMATVEAPRPRRKKRAKKTAVVADKPAPAKVAKKTKKATEYRFIGDIGDYATIDDPDLKEIYDWMAKQSSFTASQLAAKLKRAGFEDPIDYAMETVYYLIEERDLAEV